MDITGNTKVLGIFGNPIGHTASPRMQNGALQELALDYIYVPFSVRPDSLQDAVSSLRILGIAGINVTIPHKQAIMPFLDEIDPDALAIGAVNTVVNHGGKLVGYNTDGDGFLMDLTQNGGFKAHNKSVVVLGAGGSSRAICYCLLRAGIGHLTILNRTLGRAEELRADLLKFGSCSVDVFELADNNRDILSLADLVVNTTSIGLDNTDESPIDFFDWVKTNQICYDIIYSPPKTRLLIEVENRGGVGLNGSGMLIGQGVLAFEKFTGQKISFDVMKRYFFKEG